MGTSNRLLGGIVCVSGIFVWVASSGIQVPLDSHTLSPQFFPKLLSVALALLGACLFLLGGGLPLRQVIDKIRHPRNCLLVASTLLFTVAFGYVDYRLICPIYIAAALWILGRRNVKDIIVISSLSTAILYALFRYGFMVLLPEMR